MKKPATPSPRPANIEPLENRTLFSTSLSWNTVAPMPIPRAEGASFTANGKFYCFGGFSDANTLAISNEMDAYDPLSNTWTRMADCPVKVNDVPVTVDPVTDTAWCGGFFLNDGFHASALVYAYHVQTNTWSQGPSLPANVGAGQMGVVGRNLYYFGGRDSNNVGSVVTYKLNLDDSNATWVSDTPMLYTANHDGAVSLNNKIYAIGGIVDKQESTSNETHVQVFDPSTDQWTLAAPLPVPLGHIASAVTVADGDIIVAGGQTNGAGQVMTKGVYQYDPAANVWSQLSNLPSVRMSAFVGYIDGKLIVTGGNMNVLPWINVTTWTADYSNSPSVPALSIASATAKPTGTDHFIAALSSPSPTPITATYALTPNTAPATDFSATGGTLTFAPGQTQASVDVPILADTTGLTEQFTLTLSALSGGAVFTNGQFTESATGTIVPPSLTPLTGTTIGTPGSYQNDGNTIAKATDGNLNTFFDAPSANGNWVGLDLGPTGGAVNQISYASRAGWASRMNGGIFQASNSATFATGVVNLFTIPANANPPSNTLTTQQLTNTTAYRYYRYLSPAGGYGNISELQLFGTAGGLTVPTPLTGTVIGTPGSYNNQGNTAAKAFDGNLATFCDAPTATGSYTGLDLGVAALIAQISYAPRAGFAYRMVGGQFQASNTADFSTNLVTLYTITTAPTPGTLTTVTLSNTAAYRYVRYVGPANSYCNIAEAQFFSLPV
jgi:N-acetylneuraminic acid mutarotase